METLIDITIFKSRYDDVGEEKEMNLSDIATYLMSNPTSIFYYDMDFGYIIEDNYFDKE